MLALEPALPANVTLKELPSLFPSLSTAKELLLMNKPFHPSTAASVVVFQSQADGKKHIKFRSTRVLFFLETKEDKTCQEMRPSSIWVRDCGGRAVITNNWAELKYEYINDNPDLYLAADTFS